MFRTAQTTPLIAENNNLKNLFSLPQELPAEQTLSLSLRASYYSSLAPPFLISKPTRQPPCWNQFAVTKLRYFNVGENTNRADSLIHASFPHTGSVPLPYMSSNFDLWEFSPRPFRVTDGFFEQRRKNSPSLSNAAVRMDPVFVFVSYLRSSYVWIPPPGQTPYP